MTGYTRNAIVHNGVLDAGSRLLTKPFTLEQLDRELRDALAGSRGAPYCTRDSALPVSRFLK